MIHLLLNTTIVFLKWFIFFSCMKWYEVRKDNFIENSLGSALLNFQRFVVKEHVRIAQQGGNDELINSLRDFIKDIDLKVICGDDSSNAVNYFVNELTVISSIHSLFNKDNSNAYKIDWLFNKAYNIK